MADLISPKTAKTIKVLQVDDDPSLREISKAILLDIDRNLEIEQANGAQEGHQKLESTKYDVVVSDYEMPQKDGLQFLKELRENKNNIPFILFTGKGREEIAIQALNLGAQGYHNKQGSPETVYGELAHSIRLCVEHNEDKQNLIKSETKYSYLFKNMLNGFAHCKMIYDKENKPIDFVYLEVNDAFTKLTGLKKTDVIGKKVTEAIPGIEKTNPEVIEIYGRVASTGKEEQFEIFFNPIELWLSITAYSPEKGYFIELFEDISERKIAQERLGRTLEVLEKVGEGIDAGLAVIGKDYRVVWANKRLMALGVSPNKKCYQTFNHSDTVCSDCGAKKIFEQNRPLDVHEFKTVNSKGETKWIELRVTPLKDKEGNITAALELAVPIDERKKTQEALLWNEEKFRRAFETSPDPCYIGTLEEGIIVEINEAFSRVWGYTKDECLGKTSLQLGLYANGLPDRKRMLTELKLKGHFSNLEFEGRRKGGEVFSLLFSGSILEVNSKKFIYGILKDITENKKTEQKNKEEEILRNTLLDNLPCTALILEKKTRKIIASNKIAREAGATPGEVCYKKCANRNQPCPFCLAPKLWETNETQSLEVEVEGKFYRGIWMPYNDELYVHYIFDITEYKKTELALSVSEEKFRTAFARAPNAVYICTLKEGRMLEVNNRYEEIFGYKREEIIGKTSLELGIWVNPPDREEMLNLLKAKGKIKNFNINCVRKNGEIFAAQISVSTWQKGSDQVLVGIIRDVTSFRQAEQALKTSLKEMEILNEKLRVVGGLTRHDISNKLSVIAANEFLLRKHIGDKTEFTKYLDGIRNAINLSNELFEFSRTYEKIGSEKPAKINVYTCFNNAVALFSNLNDIKILIECQGIEVLADSLLIQLFYNLIDNSIKHGEKVTKIRLYTLIEKDSIKLCYEDNGVGIPKANKQSIFKVGFSTGKGSGLGLALIKRMIEVYGWSIQENGEPGLGAKFTVTIPKQT